MMGFGICWDERERRWEGCALKEGHVYARHGMCMRYEGGRDGGGIGGLEFLSLLSIQCVCVLWLLRFLSLRVVVVYPRK